MPAASPVENNVSTLGREFTKLGPTLAGLDLCAILPRDIRKRPLSMLSMSIVCVA